MHAKDVDEVTMVVRVAQSELLGDVDTLYEATRHGWALSENAQEMLSAAIVTHGGIIVGWYSIRDWEQPHYLERRYSFVGEKHDRLDESFGENLEGVGRGRRTYIVPGYDFGTATQRFKWFQTYGPNPPQDVVESLRAELREAQQSLGSVGHVAEVLREPYVVVGVTYVVTKVLAEFRDRIAKPYSKKEMVDVLECCWTYLRDNHQRPIDSLVLRSVDQNSREAIIEVMATDQDIRYILRVAGRGWNRRVRDCSVKRTFGAT